MPVITVEIFENMKYGTRCRNHFGKLQRSNKKLFKGIPIG